MTEPLRLKDASLADAPTKPCPCVPTPAPGAERPPQFRKVVEWLHHALSAAHNFPYEEGDVCLDCADAVRDELVPLVREALAAAPPAPDERDAIQERAYNNGFEHGKVAAGHASAERRAAAMNKASRLGELGKGGGEG